MTKTNYHRVPLADVRAWRTATGIDTMKSICMYCDEAVDRTKQLLCSIPDEGNTSIDMRLTFNAETRTCHYNIMLHNDDDNTRDWLVDHVVPWGVGLAMLGGEVEIPEELI